MRGPALGFLRIATGVVVVLALIGLVVFAWYSHNSQWPWWVHLMSSFAFAAPVWVPVYLIVEASVAVDKRRTAKRAVNK